MLIKAYAKINLFLHIIGKKNNGYHEIQSIFAFCNDLFDVIEIEKSSKLEVVTLGCDIQGQDNLVYKVCKILNNCHYKITINKKIPIGAGLGGGSCDAGFVLKALLPNHPEIMDNLETISSMGSDIMPAFFGGACLVSGIGEVIEKPIVLEDFYALILKPDFSLSTPMIYKNFTGDFVAYMKSEMINGGNLKEFIIGQTNSLYRAATSIRPEITSIVSDLKRQQGCYYAAMSGSGSAVFGLFSSKYEAQKAREELDRLYNSCFMSVTSLF
jgi:4-diphosphocytidyl-2-C-methyl-D-erythritol kinase